MHDEVTETDKDIPWHHVQNPIVFSRPHTPPDERWWWMRDEGSISKLPLNMSYIYSIYGLSLCSNQPIPGLVTSQTVTRVDVHIWLGSIPRWLDELRETTEQEWFISPDQDENGDAALTVRKLAGGAYFRLLYSDSAEFIIDRAAARVWATWPLTLTLEDTATYLLGPILGFALRLRGITCLHASAVAIDDRAIALIGAAGAGNLRRQRHSRSAAMRYCPMIS